MYDNLRKNMKEYYDSIGWEDKFYNKPIPQRRKKMLARRDRIYAQMDDFYREHPHMPSVLLKSKLHSVIAEQFEPILFPGNPFFFEMEMRDAYCWGHVGNISASRWVRETIERDLKKKHPLYRSLEKYFLQYFLDFPEKIDLCACTTPFDIDHHTLGYTKLFRTGITGIMEELQQKLDKTCPDSFPSGTPEHDFCLAALSSCQTLLDIANRFADRAQDMLTHCESDEERKALEMICHTARKIPANPPETFYEGLSMLLFTREALATLENIGISQLGHVDRLLGPLYEKDLAEGRITEAEARELTGIWMLHTDIKFDMENNGWPETSTCIQLGGCDEDGMPVYNAVTRMFIEEHHKLGLINPKLNCRYSDQSPDDYLQLIGKTMLSGHNNFVLINDNIVISGLIKNGVDEKDARRYVSGGCQETMIEGCGHTEGAALYISMPRILDFFLRPDPMVEVIPPLEAVDSFEAFYNSFLQSTKYFISMMTDQRNIRQTFYKQAIPCPLFSATQTGCVSNGKDYVEGGSKYNFSTIALVGLGTVADSLYGVKKLVYEHQKVSLTDLISILACNWEGYEALRNEFLALPKYGHGCDEVTVLAERFLTEVADYIQKLKNERGGGYIPSLFVYYFFSHFAHSLRATPDGRKDGDLISMGCGPGRLTELKDFTAPLRTMQQMDFTVCRGGSAVLDIKLPASESLTPEIFTSFIRSCCQYDCPTLQPNVVSAADLLDAKQHPEKHKDLIVRISGLSAYFIALTPQVQDEIIDRAVFQI